jgi:hypothetical protein
MAKRKLAKLNRTKLNMVAQKRRGRVSGQGLLGLWGSGRDGPDDQQGIGARMRP